MVRAASHVRDSGVVDIAGAGFLGLGRPTGAEALIHCVDAGAREVVLVPYTLAYTQPMRSAVALLCDTARTLYPRLPIIVSRALGDHPAIAQLILQRAFEADYLAAHAQIGTPGHQRALHEGANWLPLCQRHRVGLLLAGRGSNEARDNEPLYSLARRAHTSAGYARVGVGFLDINRPSVKTTIATFRGEGLRHVIIVPAYTHLDSPPTEQLAEQVAELRATNPDTSILLAEHLSFDRLIVTTILGRIAELTGETPARMPSAAL